MIDVLGWIVIAYCAVMLTFGLMVLVGAFLHG